MEPDKLKYICCPKCNGELKQEKNHLNCIKCIAEFRINSDDIIEIIPNLSKDLSLSIAKWDELYRKQYKSKSYFKDYKIYKNKYLDDVLKQINKQDKINQESVYLEIGCGPFYLGSAIAKRCKLIIGIDMCPHALKIAKDILGANKVKNYILIQGDILQLPIKNDYIDIIYGGGVIEHFNNTVQCLHELHRVLKKSGISVNSVPHLNIGSLTYRQIWGNIPNLPLLRPLGEYVHIKLLKGKHMIFGYELSFTSKTLINLHQKAGFKKIETSKFDVQTTFEFIPTKIRFIFNWLTKSSLFWPMIKVIAIK